MIIGDEVEAVRVLYLDQFGQRAVNEVTHVKTRISVVVTSPADSYHIEFPKAITRAGLSCLLYDLADNIRRGGGKQ